jgi:hypothetical protein
LPDLIVHHYLGDKYILTAKDEEIIRIWFEEGKKVVGFYQLLDKARKHVPRLKKTCNS